MGKTSPRPGSPRPRCSARGVCRELPALDAAEVQHGAPGTSALVGPDASSNSERDLLPLGLDLGLSPAAPFSLAPENQKMQRPH